MAQSSVSNPSPQIRRAVYLGLITERQAALLHARLGASPPSWRTLGRKLGCSRQTAQRDFAAAVARLKKNGREWSSGSARVVSRARGSRDREVWNRYSEKLGITTRCWAELIVDPKIKASVLRSAPRRNDEVKIPIPPSEMNHLFGALIAALSKPPLASTDTGTMSSPDWPGNLAWARRKLKHASRGKADPIAAAGDIYSALARGCQLCGYCHTPLLAGCRVGGQLITRRRKTCGPGCKFRGRRARSET